MRRRYLAGSMAGVVVAAAAAFGVLRFGSDGGPPPRLSPEQVVEEGLESGERHRFVLALEPGQFLSIEIAQQGIDLTASLFGPEDERLLEVDSPNGEEGREVLSWLAAAAGDHRVELHPVGDVEPGRYTLRVAALRRATSQDRRRAAAARHLFEAREIRRAAGDGHLERAAALYRRSRRQSAAVGDRFGEALALVRLGQTLPQLGRDDEARAIYGRAARLYDRLGETREAALTYNRLGLLARTNGRFDPARAAYTAARERFRSLGDGRREASMLNNLALVEDAAGFRWQALVAYRRALEAWRALGARDEEAVTLTNLGETYLALGQLDLARDAFQTALESGRKRAEEATTLNGLAVVHRRLDETERARVLLERALDVQQRAGDRQGEGVTRNNLGLTHFRRKRYPEARRQYELALELFRGVGDRHSEAFTTLNLAWLADEIGERDRALRLYRRALPVFAALGDLDGEASAHYGIARAEAGRGRLDEASASAETALDRLESVRTRARSMELRTSYVAAKHHYYELAIELSMRRHAIDAGAGYDVTAFLTSERSRARSLLDRLTERPSKLAQPPDPSLQANLERVEKRLADVQHARLTATDAAAAAAVDREVRRLSVELDRLRTLPRLRTESPAPVDPKPVLRLDPIQDQLDAETLLIEYFLGEERSFLWLVSRDE